MTERNFIIYCSERFMKDFDKAMKSKVHQKYGLGLPECDSDNPNDMCKDCVCWKHTRQMCS
jgi:hypothetical protein